MSSNSTNVNDLMEQPVKRGPGRPRKNPVESPVDAPPEPETPIIPQKAEAQAAEPADEPNRDESKMTNRARLRPPPPVQGKDHELHECGLPNYMVRSRKRLAAYVTLHGIEHRDRRSIDPSKKEMDLHQMYRRATGNEAADTRYFIAALRLWASGRPDSSPEKPDVSKLAVVN